METFSQVFRQVKVYSVFFKVKQRCEILNSFLNPILHSTYETERAMIYIDFFEMQSIRLYSAISAMTCI